MVQTHGGAPTKGFWRTLGAFLEGMGAALLVGGTFATYAVAHVVFASRDQFQGGDVGPFLSRMFETVFIYVTGIGVALLFGTGSLFRLRPRNLAIVTALVAIFLQANVLHSMEALRVEAGGSIEKVAPEDPRRVEFRKLHGESMALGMLALACGVVVIASKARAEQ